MLADDATVDINFNYLNAPYFTQNALLIANGQGSSIENKGDITSHGASSIILADNGAQADNSGNILVYATNGGNSDDRSALTRANKQGSVVHNSAGGNITLISDEVPKAETASAYIPKNGLPTHSTRCWQPAMAAW